MRKIKAIPETVNGIRFDSKLEALAYRLLILEFGKSRVTCHESLALWSPTASIPALNHRVDFVIRDEEGIPIRYVEIKGVISGSWLGKAQYIRTLMLLEKLRPNVWDKYVIWVGSGSNSFTEKTGPCDFVFPFPRSPADVKPSLFLK